MDPLSITVAVGSLLGACTAVTRTVNDLRGKYSRSDTTFSALSAECNIISSTLSQVGRIARSDFTNFSERLEADGAELQRAFQDATDCCDVTLVALGDTLQKCSRQSSQGSLSWKSKARLLFSEQELRERLQTLRSLNTAMSALLSAIQADTVSSMNQILTRSFGAMKSMRKETGSLKRTYAPSIISGGETVFEFDDQIINSAAYRRAFQSFKANRAESTDEITRDAVRPPNRAELTDEIFTGGAPAGLAALATASAKSQPSVKQSQAGNNIKPSVQARSQSPAISRQDGEAVVEVEPTDKNETKDESGTSADQKPKTEQRQETPLYNAAKEGHVEVVRLLLKSGAEAMLPRTNGYTPVNAASFNNHPEVVKLLLENKVDFTTPCSEGGTPLYWAASKGNIEVVCMLLAEGAEATMPGVNGYTPLGAAAFNGRVEMVKVLLDHSVDIDTPCAEGGTPLYWAGTHGHPEVVRVLLDAGAEAKKERVKGFTPVNAAAWKGHLKVVELLVDHGVDTSIPETYGGTPLYWAATHGYDGILTLLLAHGDEYKLPRVNGFTPMNAAAFKGHTKIIEILLKQDGMAT